MYIGLNSRMKWVCWNISMLCFIWKSELTRKKLKRTRGFCSICRWIGWVLRFWMAQKKFQKRKLLFSFFLVSQILFAMKSGMWFDTLEWTFWMRTKTWLLVEAQDKSVTCFSFQCMADHVAWWSLMIFIITHGSWTCYSLVLYLVDMANQCVGLKYL